MTDKHPLIGINRTEYSQLVQFVKRVHPDFNEDIAKAFVDIGPIYGIQSDIAFCQSIYETNWFRFTGDVKEKQNNFAGIGATGGGNRGYTFTTIEEGVRAQIQHLYAYATTSKLPKGEKLVDPRFDYVHRGSAVYWEDLAGKWAYPGYNRSEYDSLEEAFRVGKTYGQQIINLYESLLQVIVASQQGEKEGNKMENNNYPAGTEEWKKSAVEWLYKEGLLTADEWKEKIEEPLPLWAQATVYNRLLRKLREHSCNEEIWGLNKKSPLGMIRGVQSFEAKRTLN